MTKEEALERLRVLTPDEIQLAYGYQTLMQDVEERIRSRRGATGQQ